MHEICITMQTTTHIQEYATAAPAMQAAAFPQVSTSGRPSAQEVLDKTHFDCCAWVALQNESKEGDLGQVTNKVTAEKCEAWILFSNPMVGSPLSPVFS